MTTNTLKRPRVLRRKKTIATSVTAAVGALALAFATPLAAHAVTVITAGDLDAIEVEAVESSLGSQVWDVELVGHDHDTDGEFDPAEVTYQIEAVGGLATISEGLDLSLGFSADNADFLADLDNPWVTFTLQSAEWDEATGSTGEGDVVISDGSAIDLDFNADTYGTPVTPQFFTLGDHTHPDWFLSGEGTYTFVFDVSVDYSAPTVVTGLPGTVTVIIEVV